jgi:DNA polymerase (family 10)
VHSAFQQSSEEMTARVLRAIEHPWVDVIGHPTGRKLLTREPHGLDVEALITAAATHGVALEINANYHRLDLSDIHARRAKDRGVKLLISSDAHSTVELGLLRWGVMVARRAWLSPADVLNTLPVEDFKAAIRRHRAKAKGARGRARK